jgi:hypothetical protein
MVTSEQVFDVLRQTMHPEFERKMMMLLVVVPVTRGGFYADL